MNREQWHADMLASVERQYAEHQLLREDYLGPSAIWRIGKPGSSNYLTEIIAGLGGALLVHGDVQTVRFAYGPRSNPWQCLLWIAESSLDYVRGKARLGMGDWTCTGYDRDVARCDLLREIRERSTRNGYHHSTNTDALTALLKEAYRDYTDDEFTLRSFLSRNDLGWDLWEREYGQVVPVPIIMAYAGAQTAVRLLREKWGSEGPPPQGDRSPS